MVNYDVVKQNGGLIISNFLLVLKIVMGIIYIKFFNNANIIIF